MSLREARRHRNIPSTIGVHDKHVGIRHAGAHAEGNPAVRGRAAQREENVAGAILSSDLRYIQLEADTTVYTVLRDFCLREST